MADLLKFLTFVCVLAAANAFKVGRPVLYSVVDNGDDVPISYLDSTPGTEGLYQKISYTLSTTLSDIVDNPSVDWRETSLVQNNGPLPTDDATIIKVKPDGTIVESDDRLGTDFSVAVTEIPSNPTDTLDVLTKEYLIELTLANPVDLSLSGRWKATAKLVRQVQEVESNPPSNFDGYKGCTDVDPTTGLPNFGLTVNSGGCEISMSAGCSHGVYPVPAEIAASLTLTAEEELSSPPLQDWQLTAAQVNFTAAMEPEADGSFLYTTEEVSYTVSNTSPKDLIVKMEVQLLEDTEMVEVTEYLDQYTTYGCPDIVSLCQSDSPITNPPLLPSLPEGYFPSNMECDYFAGSPNGGETDEFEYLPETSPCRPGEVRPKSRDSPLLVKFYCKEHCILKWEDSDIYLSYDFKALSCHRGSSYWQEVRISEKSETVGVWPICDCGDGTLDNVDFDASSSIAAALWTVLVSTFAALLAA